MGQGCPARLYPAIDHILGLLHRFIDAREELREVLKDIRGCKNSEELSEDELKEIGQEERRRLEALFAGIAEEFEDGMRDAKYSFRTNLRFDPDAVYQDPKKDFYTRVFQFSGAGGFARLYESLGQFLASSYVRRLNKCLYCGGLFIEPKDYKKKYCPYTDHQKMSDRGG